MITEQQNIAGNGGSLSMLAFPSSETILVHTGKCYFWGILGVSTELASAGGATIIVYDGINGDGNQIVYARVCLESSFSLVLPFPIVCNTGLYVEVETTGDFNLYYSL